MSGRGARREKKLIVFFRKRKVKDQNIFLVNFQVFLTANITFAEIFLNIGKDGASMTVNDSDSFFPTSFY